METDFLSADEKTRIENMTLTINAFFGWDFNSCEVLRREGEWFPIDFANACPDSQVTSLHFHFPWLIKSNLRWSIFCAATGRKMLLNRDWQAFFEIAATDQPFEDKLTDYARIARERFEHERFGEFCERHLGHLDELAAEFFQTDAARDATRRKVEALYPAHEVETFTELFWRRIQHWRQQEA